MRKGKGKSRRLLPNSLRIISSCIKTASSNASTVVRSAGASVAASVSSSVDDRKEQVLWAGFDILELSPISFRRVLLLGYQDGFQVFDVEDTSRLSELISRRDGQVTFLQMLPTPENSDVDENYKSSHPILVVIGGEDGASQPSFRSSFDPPTVVRFYSLKLNDYVKVFDFKSAVFMVRCSRRVVAIGLKEQIYCFDTLTLEKKFIVVTYPMPRFEEQGPPVGLTIGYGPMAVGPRWLAYPPNRPFFPDACRLSPEKLASSVSPSTSPGSGSLMARYAVESSKNFAAGILALGDKGYKKISKYCPDMLIDGTNSPGWKAEKMAASEAENAGVVVVKDLVSSEVISQFRAHMSPVSALGFDPSGTLLVTASVHGNNINIFRIMPSRDWSSSYVHLYKLHRGMTTAVIQDICFSTYSQWVAIISSKGTCHLFHLPPFGGNDGIEALPLPKEQKITPCTLSVVARIKCDDSSLLSSVTNAAASMVGKMWVPSGAFAAIFNTDSPNAHTNTSSMEHILVYTPSGFVVQHEIRTEEQNEEFRVKIEPVQWWDVCRRLDDIEREECISASIFDDSEIDDKKLAKTDSIQSPERSIRLNLSNSEVQLNSGRLPIWQNPKIRFHVIGSLNKECDSGGEFAIEREKSHELENRRKDLLPIFDYSPSRRSEWIDRSSPSEKRCLKAASPESSQAREKTDEGSSCPDANFDRAPITVTHLKNDLNMEEEFPFTSLIESCSLGNENSSSTAVNADSASDTLIPLETEKTVDVGQFLKEGYCNKPELHEEGEEGWFGGMFEFSEEG